MAKGYAKRRGDFNLMSEIKNHQLTILAKNQSEQKEKEDSMDPGLSLSSSLVRDAYS